MSPRSRSRSTSERRSYSRSPGRHNSRRKCYSHCRCDSRSRSSSRQPPSPPSLPPGRHSGRYSHDSRSCSRSITPPRHHRRYSSRRHGSTSRSRSRSYSRSRSPSRSSYERGKRNNRVSKSLVFKYHCFKRFKFRKIFQEKPSPSRCIGVFGLNVSTTQHKIREIFSRYGNIERIQVVIDAQTGHSRGFCFIYYEKLADAKLAREYCCGLEVDGRRIRVDYSITERPHTPTPGVYKGRSRKSTRDKYRSRSRKHTPSPSSISHHRRRYERTPSCSYSPR
uniref:RRM domain-containing protein n=1 Tax=Glossina austeni TaxID=7395 RepID=A0A1A9UWI7_GLOAU